MNKDINYYLSKGFDKKAAEYYVSGRKKIVSVTPNLDLTLTIIFDNDEIRLYDCKPFFINDTVFAPLKLYENFKRVYLDDFNCVSWDIDPEIDSNIVWENKIDLCPDTCYIDSIPIN